MATELVHYIATADDGEPLPLLGGVETMDAIELVSIVRGADQIRLTYRRGLADIRNPRAGLDVRRPRLTIA